MIRPALAPWLVLVCSVASAAPAAGDRDAAKAAFERAMHQYNLGDFEQALDLFKEAYQAAPLPDFLFNMAQCHRSLGREGEAIFFFERYLAEHPGAPDAEQVRVLVRELRELQRRRPPPPVATASASATVTATPTPIAVAPPIAVDDVQPSVLERWWFWTAIAVGVAAIAGGALLAARAGRSELPDHPIATFDYRDL